MTEDFKLNLFSAVYNDFDHRETKCSKKCHENPNCLENLKIEDWEEQEEDVDTVAVGIKVKSRLNVRIWVLLVI